MIANPIAALSASLGVRDLLEGRPVRALSLGSGHLELESGRVISLTRPGAARLPNGIECEVVIPRGDLIWLGAGVVNVARWWDPVAAPRVRLRALPAARPDPLRLAGRGGGLTPSGDDLLCGYAAGLVLFADLREEARRISAVAGPRTTRLSATFLDHASRGELAEPAHAFLERGDPGPLQQFGHSSGRAILVGLALAGARC